MVKKKSWNKYIYSTIPAEAEPQDIAASEEQNPIIRDHVFMKVSLYVAYFLTGSQ